MTVFDALLLAILGASIFFATVRGAVRETATLVALGAGALAGYAAARPIAGLLGEGGSFFVIAGLAVAIGAGGFFAGYFLLHRLMHRLRLSDRMKRYDRLGGAAFGLVRALALIGLGFLGYGYYLDDANQPDAVRKALLLPVAASAAGFFQQLAPANGELSAGAPKNENAAADGYDNRDRAGMKEIVTTVTTTSGAKTESADPIAEILTEEPGDGEPQGR